MSRYKYKSRIRPGSIIREGKHLAVLTHRSFAGMWTGIWIDLDYIGTDYISVDNHFEVVGHIDQFQIREKENKKENRNARD